MTSKDALNAAIVEFQASRLAKQMHDPSMASGNCTPTALALLALFEDHKVNDCQLINLWKSPVPEEDKGGEHHFVVRVGDRVVDPSQRQFNEEADVPHVADYEAFIEEWDEVVPLDRESQLFAWKAARLPMQLPTWESSKHGLKEDRRNVPHDE